MGNLPGHVTPGIFMLWMGVMSIFYSLWAYLSTKFNFYHTRPNLYTESHLERKSYIPQPLWPKFPLEPIQRLLLAVLGMIVECFFFLDEGEDGHKHFSVGVYSSFDENGRLADQAKFHHLMMYSFFALSGLVDLLALYVIRYPKHTTKLFLGLAFLVEGFIFSFHLHGHNTFDVTVHEILIYVVFANAAFAFLRMYLSANLLINCSTAFCVTLQGTWLIHMGVALYGKHPLDEDNSPELSSAFMAGCFFLHFLLIAVAMLILYTVLLLFFSRVAKRRKALFPSLNTPEEPDKGMLLMDMSQEQTFT